MWRTSITLLPDRRVLRIGLARGGATPSFAEVLDAWQTDGAFRTMFTETLAGLPPEAFCWELPPLTTDTLAVPFECVVVESPMLAGVRPDPAPFAAHFATDPDVGVVVFPNLGGDATLVAPCPRGDDAWYPHLAAFVRHAPGWQQDALWQQCARAVQARLGPRPLWLSTAGLGVHWLHVRLDATPKYYRYAPYRKDE